MDLEALAHLIYEAIFSGLDKVEIDDEIYPIEQTSKSKVRLVRCGGLTYIEQNPFKSSQWGKEAQEGHQILWVMKGRQYLARVRDGKFLDLSKK